MASNTAAIVVGRLLEVRADAGYRTVSEVDALCDSLEAQVDKLGPNQPVVVVVDWRRCPVMAAGAADRLLQRIIKLNPRIERSCTIASLESPTAVLQFMRLIREAQHPDRQICFEPKQLIQWLSEVLTGPEIARLHEFLAGGAGPASGTGRAP